jgi:hypothetical protein
MKYTSKAFLGAVLLAGTALVGLAPAKAQQVHIQGYVGTDPYYGADPNYAPDPNYDPYYDQGYQDPAYDPNYDQGYQDPAYDPYYDQQYSGEYYDQYGYDYGYDTGTYYDYTDPFYFTVESYNPLYDPFYDPYCDYYTPPWGFPLDYCRYQLWTQPVYFGGTWYSGPIYYRVHSGVNWFWLNGRWCRDEWRGARPSYIDWSRHKRWDGPRHNWRDEYRRGNWAGRNTWVGRNYRDNVREARLNVLDRASDRNFRRDFAARNLRRGDVAGVRGRDFNRPGLGGEFRGRNERLDRRALRDGGSTLVRPNERNARVERFQSRRNDLVAPDRGARFGGENRALREQRAPRNFAAPDRGPRIDNRALREQRAPRAFAAPNAGPRVDNRAIREQRAPRAFAAPNAGPRVDNRAFREQRAPRAFAAPDRAPRIDNRAAQRAFAAPDRAPRFDNRAAQRSFAAPQRAPRMENRAPRVERFNGNRGAFAPPQAAPRVAASRGGQRFEARGGGGARAFSGGGGGAPRAFSNGGGGGRAAVRAERGPRGGGFRGRER